jgi:hypothetical protein
VFTVDGAEFSWADIIAHAAVHGRLAPLLDTTLERLNAAKASPHKDDADGIQRAATATRYRLNLISAEETQRWLDACGLTLDDMAVYVVRILAADGASEHTKSTTWPENFFASLWVDALFDNTLGSLAEPLALEALAALAGEPDTTATAEHQMAFTERCEGMEPQVKAVVTPRLERMAALYSSMEKFSAEQSYASLSSALARHRTDTIQLTYSQLRYSHANVANEAYLCAIIDGAEFDELSERTKTSYTEHDIFAGDLNTTMQSTLISAQPGEIVKVYGDDDYRLIMLNSKNDPDLEAAPVRSRLTGHLVAAALHSQYGNRLEWLIPILKS